ncbi:AraC family transcriptional regulator [Noviherbaspirillum cavernae]|uniref:AraC family transcriptional regulator n=1 Tax=Noviherbaspirillum cavernae TaxID=2320862 RepID=A0A418X355_9BURK|nr:AraC family transcriptional regulator [Noviherbaspirillum cavernae]RJG06873.1 AraC family transcriptional regulator [Noviherbaspirillum cavernae]
MPCQYPDSSPHPAQTAAIAPSVFKTLRGTNAEMERFAWIGDELAIAIWRRETDEELTSYIQPGHHTLSCYLAGGYRTEREQMPGMYGSPGRLCTLPDNHESHWMVRDTLRFLHVYFLPQHFTRRAVTELDREPRELTLADRTYFAHPCIASLCERLEGVPWQGADALLQANEITHAILSELLKSQSSQRRDLRLKGGLAPAVRRRLAEFIEAHLDRSITLGMLAHIACMSEYHLARMFRISFGMPPHAWIAERRIDCAKQLLKTGTMSLQQIALACGYADLSHFSHRFRAAAGVAPSRYRKALTSD